ncbi:MAG: hypothetical protein CO032_00155 [Nitrosopumilales archaeon CG_4_9_14_0_2_um_filter_34_16]|nr:MAG: hypothetical protein CO032_00155 [Nitrosopumilales archaeon CG_4_9_14_0_2_um_filter_34_16]
MLPKTKCNCSNSCTCKDEILKAKKFVKNLKNKNKFSKKQRDTFSVVHFDLRGSTKLMRKDPLVSITNMLLHNKMCRNIVEKNQGTVIKELGDAIIVVFKSTALACECAIKIIRNLKKHGGGIKTKVTIASGTLWTIKTTNEDDVYGIPVNMCTRMSTHAQENCIIFEENAYVSVQNWLLDDKKIKFKKVTRNGKNIRLNDFGPTPMRKIIVS